jgi:site-specific recombinase XerD
MEESTQRARKNMLLRFVETAGDLPFRKFRKADVKASHNKRHKTPAAADNLIKALRQVFNYAIGEGLVTENPCTDIRYKWKSTGFHTWIPEEVDQYRAHYPLGTRQRLALEILIGIGVRRSDGARLGRQHEKSGWLKFITYKGRNRTPIVIEVPIRHHLRHALDAGPTGDLTFLLREDGNPYSIAGFGNMFRKWCDAAGLPHCSAHGLRKAAAVILAENGATAPELCAVFGWNKLETAQIYIRMAEKRKMARNAFARLNAAEKRQVVSLPRRN